MSKKKISKFNLNNFEGIFPIIYSFFNKNNSLDIKAIIEEINIIHSIGAQGIASLGLATEVNKLTFKEKTKIIEIVSENWESNLPKAFTIYGNSLNEYIKLIDVAKKNKADWIILQPLIKKNTTDEDCYKFFKKLIPLANETIVGIQNAKEYLGVGLSVKKIKKLSNSFPNFKVIKNESSSVFIQEEINQLSKDVRMFNGRGGQEVVDNFLVGCKGIVPALEMADKFIKIYKLIKNKEINKANRQYAQIAPDIIFVMQSIDTLITYGKRICGYRMGMKDIYDRKPILKPTQYGMIKSKQIAKNLGKF